QGPDAHHETHDAGGDELGDDAVADGAETELAHDLNEGGGDEPEGAHQHAVATGHDSGRQQQDERDPGEEQAEGELHGGRRRKRSRPRTYWTRPSVIPTPAQVKPRCQSTRCASAPAISGPMKAPRLIPM